MVTLSKLTNPTVEQAKDYFNWEINKYPIFGHDQRPLEGFSEFRSGKGQTLHVGKTSYSPAQPSVALNILLEALAGLNKPFKFVNLGSFANDKKIFAQVQVGENSRFTLANGKEIEGLITMAKGNDESIPMSFWETMIYIICQNSFNAALRQRSDAELNVSHRQTKNSESRIEAVKAELVALLSNQAQTQDALSKLSIKKLTKDQAEYGFLGLLNNTLEKDEQKTESAMGVTRLTNTLERYMNAFVSSPGVTGSTREDWLNAITFVDTHGNKESKRFNANKQFVSSEFGTSSRRKTLAFNLATDDKSFNRIVSIGRNVKKGLVVPITVPQLVNN